MEAPLLCFGLYKELFLIYCVITLPFWELHSNTTFNFRAAQMQITFGIILEFESLNRVLLRYEANACARVGLADLRIQTTPFRNISSELLGSLLYSEM